MNVKETMKEVVTSHNLIRIATLDSDGAPCVRSVDYAMGDCENILYCITQKNSRKVDQIRNNGKIAFLIDHDCHEWEDLQKLKYIKGTGTATIVEDPEEMQKAFGLLLQKFPFLANLPGEPSDMVGIRFELKNVLVTNNSIEFGHTETLT
ncbi:MAG: pyridoxamine 5'-phosphate oxidase family protein [Thermodesulfobacteriota bacterium]|nr:pyridoxamine 5'-phosphate oxidase family protein [Thermodesulfobacteriota bacterium]